jgi:broad specificity phosphatase PhoE
VALAGHQIVNKVLVCTILGLALDRIWRIGQETAALNAFQWARHGWLSLSINDTCHLKAVE